MLPTYAQIILIVILIVPGFAVIKIYEKLIPSRRKDNFDLSVSSIILTLFIHVMYTAFFIFFFSDKVNIIIKDLTAKKEVSSTSSTWILIYLVLLIVLVVIIGFVLAFLKNKGISYRWAKKWGFQTSNFDNLWDELLYIYNVSGAPPTVSIEFEEVTYAGFVHRSSFTFGENENKEITLSNPHYKDSEMESFKELDASLIYLDLKDVKSIKFVNGEILMDSKM
ncbi:hypothetical protein VK96_25760 [Bacillus cereus]|uniref:DUF6338 family protein n=1 Tax=Bacillus cereus TaxID=1396 RepID=UPI00065CD0A0|nr:DUF6338 family protein [Bacillus cereus]KMN65685.1 hypothetical protein VK96_25760 [Bacillus cereus]